MSEPEGQGQPKAGDDADAAMPQNTEIQDPYRSVLAIFIGPNSEKFLTIWDKVGGDIEKLKIGWGKSEMSWVWPAFLVPFPWLLYRKLYIEAAILLFVPIALTFVFPPLADVSSISLSVVIAFLAKSYYLRRADRRIKAILDEGGETDAVEERIARAGGVSKPAAWLGAMIMVSIIGVAVWAAALEAQSN